MSVPLAYLGVILIWSTTPLAIKWSGIDAGYLFGVTARMSIGLVFSSILLWLVSPRRLPWDSHARKLYLVAGLAIYAAMLSVYWGSQYISSGFISVIFGLNPIVTGIMAALWLNERSLTMPRLLGVLLGFIGLGIIFHQGLQVGEHAAWGIAAVCMSVLFHSLSSVLFKKLHNNLSALEITHGGLLVSVPLYLLTWLFLQGSWPQDFSFRGLGSIIYLGIFGSVMGFMMFFYILKHIEVGRVALITLITPVVALLLGHFLNNEALNTHVWLGTGMILLGISLYQWGGRLLPRTSEQG